MVKKNVVFEKTVDAMDADNLKKEIIEQLQLIKSVDRMKDVLAIVKNIASEPGGYKLTPEQVKMLEEAVGEYEWGEFLTDDEVNRDEDEWLRP